MAPIIFFLALALICFLAVLAMSYNANSYRNNEQNKSDAGFTNDIALDFYKTCVDKGITSLVSEKDKMRAREVALAEGRFHIANIQDKYIDMFNRGKSLVQNEKALNIKSSEIQIARDNAVLARRQGINKRIELLNRKKEKEMAPVLEKFKKERDYNEALRTLKGAMMNSVVQEKPKDWALLGGLASGIAGPAAGAVVAGKAIADNRGIEARNKARIADMAQTVSKMPGLIKTSYSSEEEIEHVFNEKYDKLIAQEKAKKTDETVPMERLFETLTYDVATEISVSGAVHITVNIVESKPLPQEIEGCAQTIMDGTLRAEFWKGEEKVAVAFLPLPFEGASKLPKITGICVDDDEYDLFQMPEYDEIKIVPHALWLIEG